MSWKSPGSASALPVGAAAGFRSGACFCIAPKRCAAPGRGAYQAPASFDCSRTPIAAENFGFADERCSSLRSQPQNSCAEIQNCRRRDEHCSSARRRRYFDPPFSLRPFDRGSRRPFGAAAVGRFRHQRQRRSGLCQFRFRTPETEECTEGFQRFLLLGHPKPRFLL